MWRQQYLLFVFITSEYAQSPYWKINSFCLRSRIIEVVWKKITIKIERAFFVILWASPATHHSFQQSTQLQTVTATNLRFNTQLATANARWWWWRWWWWFIRKRWRYKELHIQGSIVWHSRGLISSYRLLLNQFTI